MTYFGAISPNYNGLSSRPFFIRVGGIISSASNVRVAIPGLAPGSEYEWTPMTGPADVLTIRLKVFPQATKLQRPNEFGEVNLVPPRYTVNISFSDGGTSVTVPPIDFYYD